VAPIRPRVKVLAIEVEIHTPARVGTDPVRERVLALNRDGLWTAILALGVRLGLHHRKAWQESARMLTLRPSLRSSDAEEYST
jgi:hypothetical protein